MSATDWSVCPKCFKAAKEKQERRKRRAKAAYGKVSDEEYQKLLRRANRRIEMPNHLREDYTQGVDDEGEYGVHYRASCADCDYEFEFNHVQQTKLD